MNNMGQMLDFGAGPGGAMISGKWINRQTGNVINVRDSFIDDSNNMVLMTDKGQMNMAEFTKYYIQASDEMYDMNGKVIDNKPVNVNEIKMTNNNNMSVANDDIPLEADPILTTPVMNQLNNNPNQTNSSINNFELIDKIFKKTESKPYADLKIEWADFPEKELSMLVSYFDVDIEDIATYIGKYLINEDLLKNALFDFINKKLKGVR